MVLYHSRVDLRLGFQMSRLKTIERDVIYLIIMLFPRTAYVGAIPIAPIFRKIPLVSCVVNKHWNVDME